MGSVRIDRLDHLVPGPAVRSGIQARDVWFVMAGPGGCHRDW
jgi:hypothetical protein